jgi:xanthine dehydrogenase large subunit
VNGQEHLYIETQGAYAIPTEQGGMRVYSSTQGPTAVQRCVSRVTALPMHQIEVDVTRSAAVSAARKIRRTRGRRCARSERN